MYKFILCPTTIDDIDFVIKAETDPENRDFVYPWTKEEHISSLNSKRYLHYVVRNNHTNELCGYVILDEVDNPSHSINLRRIVITQKGQGIGKSILYQIQKLVFTELKAHRLWLDVFTDNQKAYNLYLKTGFRQEGLFIDSYLRNDKYVSQYIMAILASEFECNNEAAN